jgi:UDPglucose 6-dehydrogenase
VRIGIGSDPRIGYHFLYPGAGFGGSCFPKDVTALLRTARERHRPEGGARGGGGQRAPEGVLADKIAARFGGPRGPRFALWGLAFKPNTDDMREAPSRVVIEALRSRGAQVAATTGGDGRGGHIYATSVVSFADSPSTPPREPTRS